MGTLLTMYGGAGQEIENEYQTHRKKFINARQLLSQWQSNARDTILQHGVPKSVLKKQMEDAKKRMDESKNKMGTLLKTISETASTAASHLDLNQTGNGFFDDLKSKLSVAGSQISDKLISSGTDIFNQATDKAVSSIKKQL